MSDVVAFSFSAGSGTIDSAGATLTEFTFDFDASPDPMIVDWRVRVGESDVLIATCLTGSLGIVSCPGDVVLVLGTVLGLVLDDPGVWTKRAAQVPEPGTLWLLLTGLAALVLVQALSRRRGCPARA